VRRRRAAQCCPRLDKILTQFQNNNLMPYTRIIESGNDIEVYEYEISPRNTGGQTRSRGKRKKSVTRRLDNAYRAKRSFQRLVGANCIGDQPPALVTFTMFEILPITHAYSALTLFVKHLRRLAGTGFRYVAVPEFQSRGAVHFHALFWGLPPALTEYERGNRILQHLWQRGFVDCLSTDGSPRLAGYLSKYMSKAMYDHRLSNQKAYSASRNVMRPVLRTYEEEFADIAPVLYDQGNLSTRQEKEFSTQWFGRGRYKLLTKNI